MDNVKSSLFFDFVYQDIYEFTDLFINLSNLILISSLVLSTLGGIFNQNIIQTGMISLNYYINSINFVFIYSFFDNRFGKFMKDLYNQ